MAFLRRLPQIKCCHKKGRLPTTTDR
ncbi:hypothetical protein B4U79_15312 [Dinothrombium tinctorium]|uniref:Uncharacterized protein n=1 Tax=Dinothrombium tinctorium TaxID=1965070 RepID=A0A3S3NR77_9ACAR|nr:hypothetical protein B4U79_15312 [Dinothrombium tinctorium]